MTLRAPAAPAEPSRARPRPRRQPGRHLVVAAAAVLTSVLAACAPGEPDRGPRTSAPDGPGASGSAATGFGGDVVAQGLDTPWSVAFFQGAALVSERDTARVVELVDGAAREVGRVAGVVPRGEGGLLGIAVREGHLYAYSTAEEGNRVERYALTGEPGSLGLGPSEVVLEGLPAAGIHNGGRIAFGPDDRLYVTVGDAGDPSSAQDRESLGGKILRLEPDGGVPSDNPFAGSPVYSYGHRNPQGIAWGPDGTLYASEFGQSTFDELNVVRPGANYGWPVVEGQGGRDGFVDPVQQWRTGEASPSGIAVADGAVHVANLRGERLRSVPIDDLGTATERLVGEHGRLRDVVVAPDGALWVVTSNTDGRGDPAAGDDRILRLDA